MSFQRNTISCCRVCLMSDCRLYDIHEYELADALWQISGTPVSRDELPQYLCAFCFMLLIKCSSFQDMCLRTQKLLKEEMDADYIHRHQLPKRCLNLTQTEVEIIEITSEEPNVKYQSEEEMFVETLDEDVLAEEIYMEDENNIGTLYVLKDDTISKINGTSDDDMLIECLDVETLGCESNISDVLKEGQINKRTAETSKQSVVTKIGNVYDKSVDRNIVEMGKENKDKMKMMTIELKNNKIEFKVADNCNDSIANDCSIIEDVKVDYRKKVMNVDRGSISSRRMKPCDLEAFGKKYNVTIVILSKEQQLEEIAIRKKSRNYTASHYRCEDCGRGYNSEATLSNHRAKHDPTIGPYSCDICGIRLKRLYLLVGHENLYHRMKFNCNQCNFVSKSRTQAMAHHAMHLGKTFNCKYCGKIFNKSSSHLSHVRLSHPEHNVVCDECGETFLGQNGLLHHKKRSHSVKFHCSTCSASFLSAEALKTHTGTLGDHADLWPCDQCGQNYASMDSLMEHVEEVHPPRRCEECDMTFTNPEAFETHVRCKHHGKHPRQLAVKWKRYQQKRKRIRAQSKEYKPSPRPCICDQCGVSVPSPALLVYHMRKHLGVLPFACPHCPKAYVANHLLNQHIASHSGEKPFKCSDCDLAFKWKSNLQRHHQVAHLGIRGSFPCPICGSMSTTKASVKVHVRAVHGGVGWPRSSKRKKTQQTIQSNSECNSYSNIAIDRRKRDRSKRNKTKETIQSDSECNSNSNIAIDRRKRDRSKRKKTQETIQSDSESNQYIQSDSE